MTNGREMTKCNDTVRGNDEISLNDKMTMLLNDQRSKNDRVLLNEEMSLNDRMTQWLTSVTLEIRFMTLNMFVGRNLPIVILGRPYSF